MQKYNHFNVQQSYAKVVFDGFDLVTPKTAYYFHLLLNYQNLNFTISVTLVPSK